MKDDKRLKRKVRNSYIVSTVSITLVLFLLGSVGYLMVAAMKVADTLQESIAVTVELENGLSDEQQRSDQQTAHGRRAGRDRSPTSRKEEKIDDAEFRKMFDSEFEEILDENPLLDSFELTLTAASADKELLDGFIAAVSEIAGVERVSYPALMAERLHATVGKIRLVLLLFGGALLDHLADPAEQHHPAGDLLETLPDQHHEARRGHQVVHHEALPRQQHHAGHTGRTGGLAAVRAFGLRAQRSRPRTD